MTYPEIQQFRIWSPVENKFYFSGGTPMMLSSFFEQTATLHTVHKQPYQRYTFLKDKNRKEIYEGDIVKIGEMEDLENDRDATIHEVKWFGDEGYPAFDLDKWWGEVNALSEYVQGDVWVLEIIGNIYQNSELLK